MKTLFYSLALFVVFAWSARAWTITISSPTASAFNLLVSFTNDLSGNAHLLKWRTPFDELEGLYSFVVNNKDGEQMEYKGPIALRLEPQGYDLLEFCLYQTRSVTVNLGDAFDFPEVGRYQVQIVVRLLNSSVVLTSNVVDVDVTTPSAVKVLDAPKTPYISFRNCDASHRNIISPAWSEFGVAAGMMKSTVVVNPQQSALYKTWFGVYDSGRYNFVYNCINRLDADFRANGKEFYCNPSGCSPGVVAYVTSGAPNTIHVCQIYFQLSNRDHIFVIVHEEMHFGAICGAPDYVYGRQGSMALAVSNPGNAVRNSDNYRFYGEDIYYGKSNVVSS